MMRDPNGVLSMADGGAHVAITCDASMPTFLLTHWVRDRTRGQRLALEEAVRLQTSRTAAAYGLHDRGRLAAGLKADINVIDLDGLRLQPTEWAQDLPANGRRLLQFARGYDATVASGVITHRHDTATGAMPGKLVRGPQRVG
jgi:N-acyl-D-amino-acid deacylase